MSTTEASYKNMRFYEDLRLNISCAVQVRTDLGWQTVIDGRTGDPVDLHEECRSSEHEMNRAIRGIAQAMALFARPR